MTPSCIQFRHVAFKSRPWNILFITLQNKSTLVTSATNVSQRKKSRFFPSYIVIYIWYCTFLKTQKMWGNLKGSSFSTFNILFMAFCAFFFCKVEKMIMRWKEKSSLLCLQAGERQTPSVIRHPPPCPSTQIRNVPRHRREQKVFISMSPLNVRSPYWHKLTSLRIRRWKLHRCKHF